MTQSPNTGSRPSRKHLRSPPTEQHRRTWGPVDARSWAATTVERLLRNSLCCNEHTCCPPYLRLHCPHIASLPGHPTHHVAVVSTALTSTVRNARPGKRTYTTFHLHRFNGFRLARISSPMHAFRCFRLMSILTCWCTLVQVTTLPLCEPMHFRRDWKLGPFNLAHEKIQDFHTYTQHPFGCYEDPNGMIQAENKRTCHVLVGVDVHV